LIVYFGGVDRPSFIKDLKDSGATHIIISYAYPPYPALWQRIKESGFKVLLDSGAFTMWRRGKHIDLDSYCGYIAKHDVDEYVVLDDPECPDTTILNLLLMEAKGLKPMPVFSFGAPWYQLDWLAARYSRIGLGGCVPRSIAEIKTWLTEVYRRHPGKQYHLFGITRMEILMRFPLASADSTSWITRWHKKAKLRASADRNIEQQYRIRRLLNIAIDGGNWQQSLFETG
jgi:hypothetical protein